MAVQPSDLLSPAGKIDTVFFPGEPDATLQERLQAYITEGEGEAADLVADAAAFDEAVTLSVSVLMGSPLFNTAAIAQMRVVQEANLPHVCQIMALALGGRVGGVAAETWNAAGAPFACRVRIQGAPFASLSADQLRSATRYEVVVPITVTTITRKHRLQVSGSLEGVDWSLLLQVEGPLGPKLAQTMRRYLCSVVSGDGA
jgi:hypothetical protein